MLKPGVHIWIWLHEKKSIMKAIIDYTKGMIVVYNDDRLILLRTGLSQKQLKQMEKEIEDKGGKRLHIQNEPFVFI